MKKLIIGVSAILFSVAANAAACSWDCDAVYVAGTSTAASGYAAYFFNNASLAQATLIAACSDATTFAGYVNTYGTEADDLSDAGWLEGTNAGSFDNGVMASAYIVVLDADGVSGAQYAYFSDVLTKMAPGSGATFSLSFGDMEGSKTQSNWTAIGVPEPTSGLLLLLGMAGMALRRRRA